MVNVTWNDAAAYSEWLSTQNKLKSGFVKAGGKWDVADYKNPVGVRLLTEAEYEYANRGRETTIFITGDTVDSLEGYANISDASAKAKFDFSTVAPFDDGEVFTSKVGKYQANGFGLHDTTGNVWSWCLDWYDSKAYDRGDVRNPGANAGGEQMYRVLRGGSWSHSPRYCRAAYRSSYARGSLLRCWVSVVRCPGLNYTFVLLLSYSFCFLCIILRGRRPRSKNFDSDMKVM